MSFIKQLVKVLKFFGIMILIELVIFAVVMIITMVFDSCGREDMTDAVLNIGLGVACLPIVVVIVFAGLKEMFGTNQTSETNPTIRILKKTMAVILLSLIGVILFCCDTKILKIVGVIIIAVPALYLLYLKLTLGTNKSSRTNQTSGINQRSETRIRYYCKWCGNNYSSMRTLVNFHCNRNPNGKHHELYEGSEKAKYECKWCGYSNSSMKTLVNFHCNKNPQSKYHEPAL